MVVLNFLIFNFFERIDRTNYKQTVERDKDIAHEIENHVREMVQEAVLGHDAEMIKTAESKIFFL